MTQPLTLEQLKEVEELIHGMTTPQKVMLDVVSQLAACLRENGRLRKALEIAGAIFHEDGSITTMKAKTSFSPMPSPQGGPEPGCFSHPRPSLQGGPAPRSGNYANGAGWPPSDGKSGGGGGGYEIEYEKSSAHPGEKDV